MKITFCNGLVLLVLLSLLWISGCGGGGSGGGSGGGTDIILTPTNTPSVTATPITPSTNWLSYLNSYRAIANLPGVTENTTYSYGCNKHSIYMVKNNIITHTEDSGNAYYTAEGAAAGQNSNVLYGSSGYTYTDAIDTWITGPFHGIGLIDPKLIQSGYGDYTEGGWYGSTIDVLRGRGTVPSSVTFPVMWPGNNSTVPLNSYDGNESPDPLTGTGYTAPTGLPIILQLGTGSITPSVTAHSLTRGGNPVTHAIYDETNYTNPDSSAQSLGRSVLNMRDAIVIIPQSTLTNGATYTVSVTTNGNTYTWSFTVASNAQKSVKTDGKIK